MTNTESSGLHRRNTGSLRGVRSTTPDDIPLSKKEPKASLVKRIASALPTFPQMRKTLKPSISLIIAVIIAVDIRTREALGSAVLLVPIVSVFYFPIHTTGVHLESVLYGTFGALLSAAWSFLGIFLGNLARDPTNPNPIQPGCSTVLAVFLFIGTFTLNYIRMHFPKANFACVNACILLTFTMTQGSVMAGFEPEIVWTFLRPIALAGGTTLAVNVLIWPDDSVSNYIAMLSKTLTEYNTFFKEHSDAFLSCNATDMESSLPSLHTRLQSSVLLLIDCKRAVQRDILYSKISGADIRKMTAIVKNIRTPLHGVGLSFVIKRNYLAGIDNPFHVCTNSDEEKEQGMFLRALQEMYPICEELADACYHAMETCVELIETFRSAPRTNLGSVLWPFPRFFSSIVHKKRDADPESSLEKQNALERLQQALDNFNDRSTNKFLQFCDEQMEKQDRSKDEGTSFRYGELYLLFVYEYNLKEYAHVIKELLNFVENAVAQRLTRRIWFPHTSVKKWFNHDEVDASLGGDPGNFQPDADNNELSLVRTMTHRGDTDRGEGQKEKSKAKKTGSKIYSTDPDVYPPATRTEHFFNALHRIIQWFFKTNTLFAFKTAVGVVLLAIPAYRTESARFYFDWRGQWAMITLVLWMFPMAGLFHFALILRVIGTIVGGVIGIVVWEICRGNPYGLVVVLFVVIFILYYLFIYKPAIRIVALMSKITLLLVVIYEYNYVLSGEPEYDAVYTVAGKRMMMVMVGLAASAILSMLPYPVIGRVELRRKLGRTIRDIGTLYGILIASMTIKDKGIQLATVNQQKSFRKLVLSLHRQIADERNCLKHAVYEPPLRGKFPQESYGAIIEKADNMIDLVHSMAYAARHLDPVWKQHIANTLTRERQDYRASIMTTLQLISSTLIAKIALPPYMISPQEARIRFATIVEEKIHMTGDQVAKPAFACYSAYMVNSTIFATELQALMKIAEDLVGVDDPEAWLRNHP